jgi:hypothetical protein
MLLVLQKYSSALGNLQFIGLVLNHADFEFALSLAALPLSMLLLLQGYLAAKHENKWMMASFLVGLVAGFAYFSYKVCETRVCEAKTLTSASSW